MAGIIPLRNLAIRASDGPAFVAGLVIAVPVAATLIAGLVFGGGEAWTHIRDTLLTGYVLGTIGTLALTAILILAFAVPVAWLITMYRFPGRGLFEWHNSI